MDLRPVYDYDGNGGVGFNLTVAVTTISTFEGAERVAVGEVTYDVMAVYPASSAADDARGRRFQTVTLFNAQLSLNSNPVGWERDYYADITQWDAVPFVSLDLFSFDFPLPFSHAEVVSAGHRSVGLGLTKLVIRLLPVDAPPVGGAVPGTYCSRGAWVVRAGRVGWVVAQI